MEVEKEGVMQERVRDLERSLWRYQARAAHLHPGTFRGREDYPHENTGGKKVSPETFLTLEIPTIF